jgi:hypothetical protein
VVRQVPFFVAHASPNEISHLFVVVIAFFSWDFPVKVSELVEGIILLGSRNCKLSFVDVFVPCKLQLALVRVSSHLPFKHLSS